jgi:hypothetical protein
MTLMMALKEFRWSICHFDRWQSQLFLKGNFKEQTLIFVKLHNVGIDSH